MVFSWQDAKEGLRQAVGLTRDISLTGAFVLTTNPPPLGANIQLKGFLPPVRGTAQALRIYGQGLVTHVKPGRDNETKGGFEVEGKPFVLRREEKFR